jgi:hypothetical protein
VRSQNPEVRYREGYEEGAWALFRTLDQHLSRVTANEVLTWLNDKIGPWRVNAQAKAIQGLDTPEIHPPHLQIPN